MSAAISTASDGRDDNVRPSNFTIVACCAIIFHDVTNVSSFPNEPTSRSRNASMPSHAVLMTFGLLISPSIANKNSSFNV